MSAAKKGEVVVMKERKEAQAAQNLEKALQEFSLPDDETLLIGWIHERFGDAAKGYFLAGLGLIKLHIATNTNTNKPNTYSVLIQENFPYLNLRVAENYMAVTRAMLTHPCFAAISKERGGYSKILTALRICSEAELQEADESGEIREIKIEQIGKVSVRTMEKSLIRAKEYCKASVRQAVAKSAKQLAEQAERIRDLEAQVPAETPVDAAMNLIRAADAKIIDGLRLLAKVERPLLPPHRLYCEPFAGSATIFLEKDRGRREVLNDINGDIINLFRVVQEHHEEFLRCLRWNLDSREMFLRLKQTPAALLTDIQRACRLFYLFRAGYAGKARHFSSDSLRRVNSISVYRIEAMLYQVHQRLEGTTLEHLPYDECLRRYDAADALFYCDPPYYGHEKDYGAGCFGKDDFERLRDLLQRLKGRFLLSLNDTPEVRQLFADFAFVQVSLQYVAGTRKGSLSAKKAQELLIANYDLAPSLPKNPTAV
ncbi:MAG: DNA adenine methylase [Desulfobaccales bacterium]